MQIIKSGWSLGKFQELWAGGRPEKQAWGSTPSFAFPGCCTSGFQRKWKEWGEEQRALLLLSACFRHFSSTYKLCNVPKLSHYFPWRQERWDFVGSSCYRFDELSPAALSVHLFVHPSPALHDWPWCPPFAKGRGAVSNAAALSSPSLLISSASPLSASPTHGFVQEMDKPWARNGPTAWGKTDCPHQSKMFMGSTPKHTPLCAGRGRLHLPPGLVSQPWLPSGPDKSCIV